MEAEKPDCYELVPTSDPKANRPYVWESSTYYDTLDTEESYTIRFSMDSAPETQVTFFPERDGVKMSSSDTPGYQEGKDRAVLGMVLMAILRSGADCIKEL